MGTANKYNESYCKKAEELLSGGKSLSALSASLKISRSTLYEWRNNHPEFKEAIDIGLEQSQAYWEDIGENGVKGNYEKFSAPMCIFIMKNRFRADYAEEKEKTTAEVVIDKLIDKLVAE